MGTEGGGRPRGGSRELFPLIARALLLAACLVVALWLLLRVQLAVLILAVAGIVGIFLNAPVTWLERRGLPRKLGTGAVLITLLAIVGLIGWLVLPRLLQEVPRLLDLLPRTAADLADGLAATFGNSPEVQRQLSAAAAWVADALEGLWQYASALVGGVLLAVVITALVLFMLLNPAPLLATYLHLMPEHLRGPATRAFERSSRMIVGWGISNLILGTIRAVGTYLFLQWVGVPGAVLWSALAFGTVVIPQVGFYIMAVPPVLIAAADSPRTALWTGLFFIVFNETLGNFVAPWVRGETMRLHPAYLLATTLLMAFAFGMIGVLIAAPVAAIVKAYLEEFYLLGRADPRTEERVGRMLGSGIDAREG